MKNSSNESNWKERAKQGAKKSLKMLKDNAGELGKGALIVTGAVTVAAAGASFVGVELDDGAGNSVAIACAVIGYKVYSAIKKLKDERKLQDQVDDLSSDRDALQTIPIEDYRNLQQNLDRILGSHDVLVTALSESEASNRNLQNANTELMEANLSLRSAIGNYYRLEANSAKELEIAFGEKDPELDVAGDDNLTLPNTDEDEDEEDESEGVTLN